MAIEGFWIGMILGRGSCGETKGARRETGHHALHATGN